MGLDGLRRVTLQLSIVENDELESLRGLENLLHTEFLDLETNWALASLSALRSLARVSNLTVLSHPLLPDCEALRLFVRAGGMFLAADGINSAAECP